MSENEGVGRGRRRIPESWSRVVNLKDAVTSQLKTYDLSSDLQLNSAIIDALDEPDDNEEWRPLFWPRDYVRSHEDLSVDNN